MSDHIGDTDFDPQAAAYAANPPALPKSAEQIANDEQREWTRAYRKALAMALALTVVFIVGVAVLCLVFSVYFAALGVVPVGCILNLVLNGQMIRYRDGPGRILTKPTKPTIWNLGGWGGAPGKR